MVEDIADRRTVGLGFVDCPREKGSGERALRRVRLVGHSSQSLGVLPVKEGVDPTGSSTMRHPKRSHNSARLALYDTRAL